MKTRCPGCQTTFRITPEQLKARAGNVRCGQCQTVFNALDSLLDESGSVVTKATQSMVPGPAVTAEKVPPSSEPETPLESNYRVDSLPEPPFAAEQEHFAVDGGTEEFPSEEEQLLSEVDAHELGRATGLILPRETAEIPGYSKWSEGVITAPFSLPGEKVSRWPFVLVATLLVLALAGQLIFLFRAEIAVTAPSLRPILVSLCQWINADLPLPRHVELISIETSDLQADPAHGNLLVLNATLRNRAHYGQAYPSLELSLTDTQDAAIARRVLPPAEYLSPKMPADQPFGASSDIAVHLWIEARDISAAGYRLYVFYP